MRTSFFLRIGGLLGLTITLSSGGCGESVSLSANDNLAGAAGGQASSLARFAIMGNTLYAVDDSHLRTFSLSTPATPVPGPVLNLGLGVETIFPQAPYLFIGSQQGMFIYNTATGTPQLVGTYTHAVSCDPVVVAGRYAYVTLRNGGPCARGLNQLDVVDLANLRLPRLVQSYPLTQPVGVGVDSAQVFVCDKDGLKIFDARNTPLLQQVQSFNIAATDVIARRGLLLVTGSNGLYQYRYSAAGAGSLQQLSRIPVVPAK